MAQKSGRPVEVQRLIKHHVRFILVVLVGPNAYRLALIELEDFYRCEWHLFARSLLQFYGILLRRVQSLPTTFQDPLQILSCFK